MDSIGAVTCQAGVPYRVDNGLGEACLLKGFLYMEDWGSEN